MDHVVLGLSILSTTDYRKRFIWAKYKTLYLEKNFGRRLRGLKAKTHSKALNKFLAFIGVSALALVLAMGLTGCSGDSSSDSSSGGNDAYADLEPVTLILADSTAADSAGNLLGQEIANQANEITGGKLTIDYHGTGELGGDTDLIRQEQSNDIQMVICQPAPMVSFVPDMAVFDLPMAFSTYSADQIETVLNGDNEFTQGLQASFEEAGLHNLGFLQNGTFRETTSNKALNTIEDFSALQIRTMENSNHMAFWQAIGAEPTPLAWAEVYFALQNGTVDAQENAIDTCAGSSLQEVQDYLAMTNHILYANNISINKEAWDSLDPAYQEALTQAISQALDVMKPKMLEMQDQQLQTLTDGGMEVIEYDQSFFDGILANEQVQALYTDISGQTDGLSDTLVAELQKTNES